MKPRSPAQLYSLIIGAVLVVAGIVGFFYSSKFSTNEHVHQQILGWFSVNGYHNVVHIVTGAVGLLVVPSVAASRGYSLVLGVVYVGIAIWGFALGAGHSLASIIPVNTGDDILHLAVGILGLLAFAGSTMMATSTSREAGPPPAAPTGA
jgi:hypothetical protein